MYFIVILRLEWMRNVKIHLIVDLICIIPIVPSVIPSTKETVFNIKVRTCNLIIT